ncbi:hypothetical protein GPECTOR_14g174 [Gonium pectorale]|uniref:Protein kinase domain-containing protein n=1 Tax=Gonium pectorale TaxID=33097 RepID=A0A150GMC6_GONPE|nr:hypothetical protein GPECTOR_14g174 [Gonium pectorale]|eukprot:KXZ50928.1 hypothetical protein GPECTOR_14g174 [Gonium pectorale]
MAVAGEKLWGPVTFGGEKGLAQDSKAALPTVALQRFDWYSLDTAQRSPGVGRGRSGAGADPWNGSSGSVKLQTRSIELGVERFLRTFALTIKNSIANAAAEDGNKKALHGSWHGLAVAVKSRVINEARAGPEATRRQRSVMEVAISTSLDHPNVVRSYAYELRRLGAGATEAAKASQLLPAPGAGAMAEGNVNQGGGLVGENAGGSNSSTSGGSADEDVVHQLLVVQELCEAGSLRSALVVELLPGAAAGLAATQFALALAADVAAGMTHIHSRDVVHGVSS